MLRYIGVLTFLLMFSSITMGENKNEKVFPYSYSTNKLDNGLTVILIPMDSPGLISYYTVVRTGSRDEWEPGKSGFAHFFEHMMFRGTDKYPGPVYDSIITSIGADANAFTDNDLTVYHLNFAKEDLPKVMELESDRFQNLKYSKEQFQTESGAVYGEYRKGKTNPFSVANEKLQDLAFDKHTYKHTTIGFEADIKNMPNLYEYSISFYNRYYRPENVVLLIVGDINENETLKMVNNYYKGWKPGYVKPNITPEPEQTSPRNTAVKYKGKALPLIMFGFKNDAFDVTNKRFVASTLLADLAFGEISNLYKELVLNEQKVQYLRADPGESRDPGLFYIIAMVKNEKDIDNVNSKILSTLEKFKTNPVDTKKLDDLKKREKYSFLMSLDTPDNVASHLVYYLTFTGGINVVDQYYNQLNSITPQDIMEAAKYYFNPNSRSEVILKGEAK